MTGQIHNLPKCGRCERPMRPHGSKAGDWPNTIARGTRGLCATCTHQRSTGAIPNLMPQPRKRTAHAVTNLGAARGLPGEPGQVSGPWDDPEYRRAKAEEWTPALKSVALLCAEHGQSPSEVIEFMSMLGCFDAQSYGYNSTPLYKWGQDRDVI